MMYRLLVTDDSPLYRLRLSQIFAASDSLQLVGLAGTGREAVRLIKERRPDVLVLDLDMPGLDGFTVLRWTMKHAPLPVVVCSVLGERESVFKALEAGAVDFITKPELRYAIRSEEFAEYLRFKVEAAAAAQTPSSPDTDTRDAIIAARVAQAMTKGTPARLVCIVGSAGSPAAVGQLFSHLSTNFSTPVIIALHMPQGFTRSFAERLARTFSFNVSEARDGEAIEASRIYIAPGGQHTLVTTDETGALRLRIKPSDGNGFYAPSANRLLASLAETCADESLAIVLTGMGDDGLEGARAVHQSGGRIIVESRDTAVIWGMPRAIAEADLADAELTPAAIAATLPMLCRNS